MTEPELPRSARRVVEAARGLGIDIDVVTMPESTRTAEEAAAACGCGVGQIVKSLVFAKADGDEPVLFLVSGSNRLNEAAVSAALGFALARPDARYVRDQTGFAIGGIPPFGHQHALETYLDRDLLAFDTVWAAAGTPRTVFSIASAALRDATAAHVLDVR